MSVKLMIMKMSIDPLVEITHIQCCCVSLDLLACFLVSLKKGFSPLQLLYIAFFNQLCVFFSRVASLQEDTVLAYRRLATITKTAKILPSITTNWLN